MDISKVSKKDLVGPRLQRLLEEIEDLSQDGEKGSYQKLTNFIAQLMKVGSNLEVTKDGKKVIGVKVSDDLTEEVDFIEVLKLVDAKITNNINNNTANKEQQEARKTLKDKMSQTIGVLLNEDKIVSELVQRGVTDREFIDNAEAEIIRSQEKVDMLQEVVDKSKEITNLFGRTIYSEVSKEYISKSLLQELKDCEQAGKIIKDIHGKVKKIEDYLTSMSTMDSDSNEFKANERAIEPLFQEVKTLRKVLKDLGVGEFKELDNFNAKDGKSVENIIEYFEGDKDNAKNGNNTNNANNAKNGNNTNNANNAKNGNNTNNANNAKNGNNTNNANNAKNGNNGNEKGKAYEKIEEATEKLYSKVRTIIKSNLDLFNYENEAEVDKLSNQKILDSLNIFGKETKKYESEIGYEKEYQAQTRNLIEKYKEKLGKKQDLEDKFVIRQRPAMRPVQQLKVDANGEPEIDANGEQVWEDVMENGEVVMEPAVDNDGNPIMENYRAVKDDIRKNILKDNSIDDEAEYIQSKADAAISYVESQEQALTKKEKRKLIRETYKQDGKWHPVKGFLSRFFVGTMWKRSYKDKYLSYNISVAESEATKRAREEIDAIVADGSRKDENDLDILTAELYYVKSAITHELKQAVSQEKISDSLTCKIDEQSIKTSARRAASAYGLTKITAAECYVAQIRFDNGEISQEELERIKSEYDAFKNNSVKMTEAQMQNRAYSDDLLNTQTSRPLGTFNFKDKKVEPKKAKEEER